MKEIKLYREDNGQYSTNEAQQDDISGWYVQKTDYDELKSENEELLRQLKIRDELSCRTCKGAGTVLISIDDGMDCPECAKHLADIKADAVIEAANTLCITGSSVKTVRYDKYIEYAEELREGK